MQVVGPTLGVIRVRSKRMPKLLPKDITEDHRVQARWKPEDSRIRRDQVMGVHDNDGEQARENIKRLKFTKELRV